MREAWKSRLQILPAVQASIRAMVPVTQQKPGYQVLQGLAHVVLVRAVLSHIQARIRLALLHLLTHVLRLPAARSLAHEGAPSHPLHYRMRKIVVAITLAIHLSVATFSSACNGVLTEVLAVWHAIRRGGPHKHI